MEEEKGEREIKDTEHGVFDLLPEGCVAKLVSQTTSRDACSLSLVSRTFCSAAGSDSVWDQFLPADYRNIIAVSVNPSLVREFSSKKELYLHLCDHPLIIDGGKKSFSLDKSSGKKSYILAARDLKIMWGDTLTYWTWHSFPESRFMEVAELDHVWWLEIRGTISSSMLSEDTTYGAYLVFKLTSDAYGFELSPAEASFGISGANTKAEFVSLVSERRTIKFSRPSRLRSGYAWRHQDPTQGLNVKYPRRRKDDWLEVELGEFVVNKREENEELEMTLMELKSGGPKGGLIVEGIEIRPK